MFTTVKIVLIQQLVHAAYMVWVTTVSCFMKILVELALEFAFSSRMFVQSELIRKRQFSITPQLLPPRLCQGCYAKYIITALIKLLITN